MAGMRAKVGFVFLFIAFLFVLCFAGPIRALADATAKNVGAVYLCNFLSVDSNNCAKVTNGALNITGTISSSTTFPYSGTSDGQTATAASFVGIAGFVPSNGTIARLQLDAGLSLKTDTISFGGSAVVTGTGVSGAGIPRVTVSSDSNILATQSGTWNIGSITTLPLGTNNITQFGGVAISTGTGASGTGIPRVTVSNDSNILATQSGTWNIGSVTTLPLGTNNITQFGGTNISTGTGASGAGIPRVTISNDSSLAANQSVNVNQWGGAATTLGQKTMASSVPVTISSDQTVVPANETNNKCSTAASVTNAPISINTAVTTQVVAISGSTQIYICKVLLMAAGATNVTLEYGTGSLCATGLTTLTGAMPLAAQAGWVEPMGFKPNYTTPAGQAFCIVNSAAVQVSGSISYVQV